MAKLMFENDDGSTPVLIENVPDMLPNEAVLANNVAVRYNQVSDAVVEVMWEIELRAYKHGRS